MSWKSKVINAVVLGSFVVFSSTALADKMKSKYTSIAAKDCITISSDSTTSVQECSGFQGYQVKVYDVDLRQSIDLVKNGKVYPLNFWDTVTYAFSALGNTAEWRYSLKNGKANLKALIVRLNIANEDGQSNKSTLVVSKISARKACVVGKVLPMADGKQNVKARELADKADTLPCL